MKRKTIFAFAFAIALAMGVSMMGVSASAALADERATTYQSYSILDNVLIVFSGDDQDSMIYFMGLPEDYDGTAVSPICPTYEYVVKQKRLQEIAGWEDLGDYERAQELRSLYGY